MTSETVDGVLALVGLRGSGKSTIGRRSARRLGVPFVDLDAVLESLGPTVVRLGRGAPDPVPVGELLERIGLERFRWLESRALHGLLAGSADLDRGDDDAARAALAGWDVSRTRIAAGRLRLPRPCVLATGGGAVELAANRRVLCDHAHVVWLEAPTPVLAERLRRDPTPRPALQGPSAPSEIDALRERREPFYVEVAAAVVHTDREPDEAAARLADLWLELSHA